VDRITRNALGIALATGTYGISFGVLAVTGGLSVAQASAMSLLIFTGASQFAVVGVLGAGGAVGAAIAPALLLAARNAFYGISLAPIIRGSRLSRILQTQLVIDETTAMARAQDTPEDARRAFLITGIALFLCWNAGTLIGAFVGEGLGDPRDYGLDAMFPAAFVALLAPQMGQPGAKQAALIGIVIAVALVPFVTAGIPILAASLAIVPVAVQLRRRPVQGAAR
jgi:4-azaleucine resistance transporter AzlC